jgi:hypothetical protein
MGRCDKIDVVTADFLEPGHVLDHLIGGDPLSSTQMANLVVLAKKTPEIAVGEKNSP